MLESLPDPSKLIPHALCFLRVTAIMFALPIIGDAPTPIRVRILCSLAISIAMHPIIKNNWAPDFSVDLIQFGFYVLKELFIGIVLGFLARIAFDSILMAANVCAYQMGFGTATLLMPELGGSVDSFTALHRMIVVLFFLTLNFHHIWIAAIADSFRLLSGGSTALQGNLGSFFIESTAAIFSIALQLAAPLLVALLFAMASLGLVARTVPQINVFAMSFPVSFFLGLFIYLATLPLFPTWLQSHFEQGQETLFAALRLMRG